MRIILTGATGFVGREALTQLLMDERVEGVTCISRRPVEVAHPKLIVLLQPDFTTWRSDQMKALSRHDAAIWALGAKASDVSDPAEYERVTVRSTLALASAMTASLDHVFRFCYLSGMGADPSETSTFPWQKMTRHMKGRTERGLAALARSGANFRASSFRPGGILPKETNRWLRMALSPIGVPVDVLCRVMIAETLCNNAAHYRVLSNGAIRTAFKSCS